jgi:hypothetical protein
LMTCEKFGFHDGVGIIKSEFTTHYPIPSIKRDYEVIYKTFSNIIIIK